MKTGQTQFPHALTVVVVVGDLGWGGGCCAMRDYCCCCCCWVRTAGDAAGGVGGVLVDFLPHFSYLQN